MKKVLLILCACAILLTSAACGGKKDDKKDKSKETGEAAVTVDIDGDGIQDGTLIEGTPGTSEGPAIIGGDEINSGDNSADDPDNSSEDPQGGSSEVTPDSGIQTPEIIAEGGTEPGLWPEENVPEDVPAYDDYEEMYPITHTDNDTSEEWYLSFDATEQSYEEYLDKLKAEGYKESDKIYGFWGNGQQILNIFTEEVGGVLCVSIDIFKSKPVEYPATVKNIFPEFKPSDSTLYGWYITDDAPKTLSVSYACGENFAQDLAAYKNTLANAGFTVTEDEAYIDKDGKTYSVRYGDAVDMYEDCLEYVYHG